MPSRSASKLCGSGRNTLKRRNGMSPQSRSGGGDGMQTVGYDGSQLLAGGGCTAGCLAFVVVAGFLVITGGGVGGGSGGVVVVVVVGTVVVAEVVVGVMVPSGSAFGGDVPQATSPSAAPQARIAAPQWRTRMVTTAPEDWVTHTQSRVDGEPLQLASPWPRGSGARRPGRPPGCAAACRVWPAGGN